jgi:glycosyltransferase involved in cell wall biosynthesis
LTVFHSGPPAGIPRSFEELRIADRRLGPFHWQAGLRQAIAEADLTIFMFDVWWLSSVLQMKSWRRTPVIAWGHRYGAFPVVNQFRDYLMKQVDGILLYSVEHIPEMLRKGISREKIFVANNTMKIGNAENLSAAPKQSFLFVGRAQPRKRIDQLLCAFATVQHRLPKESRIEIVGDGPENEVLKRLTDELGLTHRVLFHGSITDEAKLRDLFQRAYAYVSPGPVGLGVLHSMAYGTPVVTSLYGKHGPEYYLLRHGDNSLLFENQFELGEALVRLTQDVPFRIRLGEHAYQIFQKEGRFEEMIQGFDDCIQYVSSVNRSLKRKAA